MVGSSGSPILVDPLVTRTKFDRELAAYQLHEQDYLARGWWIAQARYPQIVVVFGVRQLKPPSVRFGALLDFRNYDLWPPSVRLVDPFTLIPYKASELPTRLTRLTPQPQFPGAPAMPQDLVQAYGDDDPPFICLPGIREYHAHPAHTTDRWELRRGGGEGTLLWILDKLWEFGVRPVTDYQANVEIQVKIVGLVQSQTPS